MLGKRMCGEILDKIFNKGTPVTPATAGAFYMCAMTTAPGEDGTGGTEVSGGGYAPVLFGVTDFAAASSASAPASLTTASNCDFGTATGANWGTIVAISVYTNVSTRTEATYVGTFALSTSQAVNDGQSFNVSAGSMTITLGASGTGEFIGKRQAADALDWVFNSDATAFPTTYELAAWIGDPGTDGSGGAEATGGSYAAIGSLTGADWNAATDADPAVTTNNGAQQFPIATDSWGGAVTHLAIFTGVGRTEAAYIGKSALSSSETPSAGRQITIADQAISCGLD